MCTLTVAWQVFPDAPVVVAANRDERVDRPAAPPAVRDWERPVVAPLDEEAEGTWIGYNDAGLLVAITNRWARGSPGDRSRGLLVRDALQEDTAEDAARYVEREVEGRSYEPFNLVCIDENACILLEWDEYLQVGNLNPGVHIVVNVGADGSYFVPENRGDAAVEQAGNADRVRTALQPEPGESADEWLDRARRVIADHEYGVCVHRDGFGTRSSSLVRLGTVRRYEFADGPPCETTYERIGETV